MSLESAPRVRLNALHEGEEIRLRDWIEHDPALLALVDRARALAEAA